MAPSVPDVEVINVAFVANISRILSSHKIPNVLWGHYPLNLYGVPTLTQYVDFVIPDESLAEAVRLIQQTGLSSCKNPQTCQVFSNNSPPPVAHVHIHSSTTVGLYLKSSTLWFIPSLLQQRKPSISSQDIISASNPQLPRKQFGRGQGAFSAEYSDVSIPSANCLLEAFVRQIARTHGNTYEGFWLQMVTYIEQYVDGDGLLDETKLDERCRVFYRGLKNCKRPLAELLDELKAGFARSGD